MAEMAVEAGMLSQEARRILSAVCENHLDGELTVGAPDAPTVCTRVGFERLDGKRLELSLPASDCDPVYLSPGDDVTLRFTWHDQLYYMRGRVKRRLPSVSNGLTLSDMLYIEKFGELKRIQRRDTYRISLLDLPPPLISFMRPGESTARATGSLIELSESGGGTLVAEAAMPELLRSDRFRVGFDLPGDDGPQADGAGSFVLDARIVRRHHCVDDFFALVGLTWELDGSWTEARRVQTRLGRFIASLQRTSRR